METTKKKSKTPSIGEMLILNPPMSFGIERIKPVNETAPDAIAVVDKDKILPATNSPRLIGVSNSEARIFKEFFH